MKSSSSLSSRSTRRIANREVTNINDLVTLNLDIRQFAQDVIENCEGPELLRAFWHTIEKVTILDPTCGSGAFLFAALIPRYSKPILDQIDRVLARHYGFTAEELDFILNYDIKYRLGQEAGE